MCTLLYRFKLKKITTLTIWAQWFHKRLSICLYFIVFMDFSILFFLTISIWLFWYDDFYIPATFFQACFIFLRHSRAQSTWKNRRRTERAEDSQTVHLVLPLPNLRIYCAAVRLSISLGWTSDANHAMWFRVLAKSSIIESPNLTPHVPLSTSAECRWCWMNAHGVIREVRANGLHQNGEWGIRGYKLVSVFLSLSLKFEQHIWYEHAL